ncbi:DUF3135 domain-containing protein [Halioxenophilus sp. WMMB6]|uniref:DUF3135 domain-containing protein n=1 Tax=Halioxenophilus sp. WMMB6 TaxID=3073815 RepID=UPI00295EC45C|nr:DUF3135 domain-containing protein [Halioxenophilus sp. WMMB6]
MKGELPDFDTLAKLSKENPEAFERLRMQHINALLERAPSHMQRRLRGLQFQIDAKRQAASNPMQACIMISRMMHESFDALRKALNGGLNYERLQPIENSTSAQIIPFKAPAFAG